MNDLHYQIITFYEFKPLTNLPQLKEDLLQTMKKYEVYGTILIADEGFNSTVCGHATKIPEFVKKIEQALDANLKVKSSFHKAKVFKRQKVRIKKEIVTLKKRVNIERGEGTHVTSERWNALLNDPSTLILDARNDYEHKLGTFRGAINPKTDSFHELPSFVARNLDPDKHKRVGMFCTGGIRCEKFAPYLKEQGFKEVYQLEGGILKYLEETSEDESLWEGECFVFDERISVDENLEKGSSTDPSQKDYSEATKIKKSSEI